MKPRTLKGPVWLDGVEPDPSKVASTSKLPDDTSPSSKKGKEKRYEPVVGPEDEVEVEDKAETMKEDTRDDNIDDMEWMKRHMSRSMQLEEGPSKEFYQDDDDDISGKRDEAVSLYNDVKNPVFTVSRLGSERRFYKGGVYVWYFPIDQPVDSPLQADGTDEKPKDNTPTETILRTRRLFVRNLAFTCTDSDLRSLFSEYGEVSQVRI